MTITALLPLLGLLAGAYALSLDAPCTRRRALASAASAAALWPTQAGALAPPPERRRRGPARTAADEWRGTELPLLSVSEGAALVRAGGQLPMARWPDPILRHVAAAVPADADEGQVRAIASGVLANLKAARAVGLAANQAGVDARLIVLGNGSVLVNPTVVARSPEVVGVPWRETCLVLPADVEVDLLRDAGVVIESGLRRRTLRRFTGAEARAVQHELDHLNGVLIVDYADLRDLPPRIAEGEGDAHAARLAAALARPVDAAATVPSAYSHLSSSGGGGGGGGGGAGNPWDYS